jgi:D-aspartate ligase
VLAHPAVVLGMYETGLAVARSLGRTGIRVLGVDLREDLGFRSRYVEPWLCPHPLDDMEGFLSQLERLAALADRRPVLFITSDEYLLAVSRYRERLERSYLLLLPPADVVEAIEDKWRQANLAAGVGISIPKTFSTATLADLPSLAEIPLPAIVKGRHVTCWRRRVSAHRKGFVVTTEQQLRDRIRAITHRRVETIVQELIPGPDTNHFKVSTYLSGKGEVLLAFGLRKIRQCPPGSGFGCLVESYDDPTLLELGTRLFTTIGYRGVGSAEFKLDPRDGKLKLIELNPRYWQQLALAERCGVNLPLVHYLDLTGQDPPESMTYLSGVKWQNLHRDIDSFREYRRRGELSTLEWLRSLRGPMVNSCFSLDDPIPGLHGLLAEPAHRLRNRIARLMRRRGSAIAK